ncbi:hypothetical protein B0E52_01090 [Rhodanobacter sp. C06]|uniref:DUF4124 domain-containing protein n=1 Tax=Rhodanobacter sp. C06 TaxID=1945854 RepID=UPI000986FA6B|nr:DUF4124 domain-containing protein [Rhodanobacter sp. C06]OOG49381.1 hypothetical protein B0E52_01090 [Rhodanobacter sp. C06]
MRVLVLLLLLPLCTLALPARAQNTIHHCVDAHGNPLFTDQPCTSQQATPVQAPAPVPGGGVVTSGLPVPLQRCASTAAELRQRVIDAFAARDPNQLAGLMLWHGYGRVSAVGDLRALSQLVRQPLLEIHLGGAPDDDPASAGSSLPPEASSAATPADELQLRTSGDDGERSARFVIARQAGCLWLRYGS